MATISTRFGNLGRICDRNILEQDVANSISLFLASDDGGKLRRSLSIIVTESVGQTNDAFAQHVDIIVLVSRLPQTVEGRVFVTAPEDIDQTIVGAIDKFCIDQVPA